MQTTERVAAAKLSDMAIQEFERLNNRLASTLKEVIELRARVSGSMPPEDSAVTGAESAFNLGGFVGSVGQGLEHAHRTLSDVEHVIGEVAKII